MSQDNQSAEQVDQDLQDLLEDSSSEAPDFSELFEDEAPDKKKSSAQGLIDSAPSSKDQFPEITVIEEDPSPLFNDKNYYQKILQQEGDVSQRLHKALAAFLKATDSQDRTMYRMKIGPIYWELYTRLSHRLGTKMPEEKRMLMRFGYLLPTTVSKEQRNMLSRVIRKNKWGEPVLYADEWLQKVAYGEVNPLATDEEFSYRKNANDTSAIKAKLDKAKGAEHAQTMLLLGKQHERDAMEEQLKQHTEALTTHTSHHKYEDLTSLYDGAQKASLRELNSLLRRLSTLDRDMQVEYRNLENASKQVREMQSRLDEAGGESQMDQKVVDNEVNSLRQMAKMSVGRQGNHFPILMKQYFPSRIEEIATRENVLKIMAAIEKVDPGLFRRSFKGQVNRIVPYVILLPCYGDRGICWEPFEKFNRATSRGRIAVPLFPKELKDAVITALADLRWQVAKEKAQHYWMEEGLTGHYYQWFSDKKLKGDVRLRFIDDYYLWITKESDGVQKLDKDVRGVFWRNMPFPEELRKNLKNRGFVYNELYKKDVNRSMSDGY